MKERKNLIMLPGPTNVPDRVMRALAKPIISHRGPEFAELYESIEGNLKYVFQTRGDVFMLSSSGTGGVDCAISNTVNPGDKVLVPVFGVFSERLKEKISRIGGEAIELSIKWGTAPRAEEIAHVVERENDVKSIALIYNETSTGATVRDLPEIGEVARENGLLLIVDAISILGGDHLPVDDWNVDLCVGGSQKCLACPPGLAMVSVSERAWETIEKTTARPYYFDLVRFREFGEKKQTPFTPALPIFYALDEALKMIREEGLEERFRRHTTCAEAFYEALEALKLKPYPDKDVCSNTVIAVNVPANVEDAEVRDVMKERYNVMIGGGMGKLKSSIFRIGCMGAISEAKTLRTIDALENTLMDVGHKVDLGAGIEAAKKVFR